MPPSLQMEQVGGFALYMAKAVLNGRGDELVDRSNESVPMKLDGIRSASRVDVPDSHCTGALIYAAQPRTA